MVLIVEILTVELLEMMLIVWNMLIIQKICLNVLNMFIVRIHWSKSLLL